MDQYPFDIAYLPVVQSGKQLEVGVCFGCFKQSVALPQFAFKSLCAQSLLVCPDRGRCIQVGRSQQPPLQTIKQQPTLPISLTQDIINRHLLKSSDNFINRAAWLTMRPSLALPFTPLHGTVRSTQPTQAEKVESHSTAISFRATVSNPDHKNSDAYAGLEPRPQQFVAATSGGHTFQRQGLLTPPSPGQPQTPTDATKNEQRQPGGQLHRILGRQHHQGERSLNLYQTTANGSPQRHPWMIAAVQAGFHTASHSQPLQWLASALPTPRIVWRAHRPDPTRHIITRIAHQRLRR